MAAGGVSAELGEFLEKRWWLVALRGLAGIVFGILCLLSPAIAGFSILLVFAVFAIVDGLFGLGSAFGQARRGERWVWLAVESVASLVIGVLMLAMPGFAVAFVFVFVTVKAVLAGILLLVSAVKLDGVHGRWLLAANGVLSLAFAALMLLAPLVGLKVLVWWIGIWSFAFGVLFVALGFKLRAAASKLQAA